MGMANRTLEQTAAPQIFGTPLTAPSSVFADCVTRTVTVASSNLLAGYTLDDQFGGRNQIAFVQGPITYRRDPNCPVRRTDAAPSEIEGKNDFAMLRLTTAKHLRVSRK